MTSMCFSHRSSAFFVDYRWKAGEIKGGEGHVDQSCVVVFSGNFVQSDPGTAAAARVTGNDFNRNFIRPYGLNWLSDSLMNIAAELRQLALVLILLRAGLAAGF